MKKILLIGNPNTGKTTLFNTITRSNAHAGNWHGVTVAEKTKKFKHCGSECELVDLPGLYSIDTYSEEEQVAKKCLEENREEVVINICDANHLARNLKLTLELLHMGANVVLAVNMAKEQKEIDYEALGIELGVPVVPIDARKKKSAKVLLDVVLSQSKKEKSKRSQHIPVSGFQNADEIFRQIKFIMRKVKKGAKEQKAGLCFMDRIVTNRFLFLPIFVLVMGLVFFLTFGPVGAFLSGIIGVMSDITAEKILSFVGVHLGEGAIFGFLESAIFGGLSSVLEFLPQVALLFFCLGVLEDSGFLPRVAYMMDGSLKKVGLTGRALFSILMGFGCTTTAMMTTRGMDNPKLKKRTAFVLPFMSCSAKLPIFLVIASAFFAEHKVLVILGLYFLSIIVGIFVSAISAKISANQADNYFLMELPKYRFPSIKKILGDTWRHVLSFLTKVGTIILLSSTVIWMLMSFSPSFEYLGAEGSVERSILGALGNLIFPLFQPLGISSAMTVVAILTGFVGKEMVVSTIGIVNGVHEAGMSVAESICLVSSPIHFSFASALSFAVFILLYPPCESAFVATKREFGWKFAGASVGFGFLMAYVMSFVVFHIALGSRWMMIMLGAILLAIIIRLVIKFKHREKQKSCEVCNDCNKLCGKHTKAQQSGS